MEMKKTNKFGGRDLMAFNYFDCFGTEKLGEGGNDCG